MRRLLALIMLSTGCADSGLYEMRPEPPDAGLLEGVCGDGVLDSSEQCDDGNEFDTDACLNKCQAARCGDGVTRTDLNWGQDGYEQCDDGNEDRFDACTDSCKRARCGDGIVRRDRDQSEPGFEVCDDGNESNADGCSNACLTARCGDGVLRTDLVPSAVGYEACDDGNSLDDDACTNGCQQAICGDGVMRLDLAADHPDFESCDDGNNDQADACLAGCVRARCGDSVQRRDLAEGAVDYEGCDDGNELDTDACLSDCQVARCGDAVVRSDLLPAEPGFEQCDDGNDWPHDGCAECQNTNDAIYDLSAYSAGNCAHRNDGSTWCWSGGAPARQSLPPVRQIVEDTVVLVDGRVARWGQQGLAYVPGLDRARRLARAFDGQPYNGHTCVVVTSGRVYCWGTNFTGQLGNGWAGVQHHQALPVAVQGIDNAVDIVATAVTTCALRSDGSVSCWGLVRDSLLTLEPVEITALAPQPIPQVVAHAESLRELMLGGGMGRLGACGLDSESVLRCWGMTPHHVDEVIDVSRTYHCASPSACYGCLVKTNGEVFCAGDNTYGQLGVGVRAQASTEPVSGLPESQKVVTGPNHACALTQAGAVYCWGSEEGLAQEAPERHCDGFDNNGNCLGEKRYSALPLEVVFD